MPAKYRQGRNDQVEQRKVAHHNEACQGSQPDDNVRANPKNCSPAGDYPVDFYNRSCIIAIGLRNPMARDYLWHLQTSCKSKTYHNRIAAIICEYIVHDCFYSDLGFILTRMKNQRKMSARIGDIR